MKKTNNASHPTAKRNLLLSGLTFAAIAAALIAGSDGFGQQETAAASTAVTTTAAPTGLNGLLADEVPIDIDWEHLGTLGKPWEKWTEAVSANLSKLYEDDTVDLAGQRTLLIALQAQLKTLQTAILSAEPSTARDQFMGVYGRLVRRVDVVTAVYNTLTVDTQEVRQTELVRAGQQILPALTNLRNHLQKYQGGSKWMAYIHATEMTEAINKKNYSASVFANAQSRLTSSVQLKEQSQREFLGMPAFLQLSTALQNLETVQQAELKKNNTPALRASLKKLLTALENYEATNRIQSATTVRIALEECKQSAADNGHQMTNALRTHYVNYNSRIYVSESFLNKFVNEQRTDTSGISDQALGAQISGCQTTTTQVSVDLKPSSTNALIDIRLTGTTQSSTTGTTEQATIYTSGYHTFTATQPLSFDGDRFHLLSQPQIYVNANNETVGAETKYSGFPILGSMIDSYAMGKARERRAEGEALTRDKIAERVLPEFQKEINKTIAKANQDMQDRVLTQLKKAGLMPDSRLIRTTDDYLIVGGRIMSSKQLGGGTTNFTEQPGPGLTIRLHESMINNALDHIKLAGRKLTSHEVTVEIRKALSQFLGSDYEKNTKEEAPKPTTAKSNDKFIFDAHDPVRIRIRDNSLFVVLRCGLEQAGEKPIPAQQITIPLKITVTKAGLEIVRGDTVSVIPMGKPKSRAVQLIRSRIMGEKIKEAVPAKEVKKATLEFDREGKQPIALSITKLKTVNGWLTVWVE